ncbi:MAG: hypothetical protein U1E38_08460, partial [Rhodospirillales bacterium]
FETASAAVNLLPIKIYNQLKGVNHAAEWDLRGRTGALGPPVLLSIYPPPQDVKHIVLRAVLQNLL